MNRSEDPRAAWTPFLGLVLLLMAMAVAVSAYQTRIVEPRAEGASETPYSRWVREDVAYIITEEERAAFKRLQTDEEREHFIEQFWLRRDPTPGTTENEFKEEHYRRIAYANAHYASGIPGWKTDRGRIYIIYGPPDELESHPGTLTEKWLYHHIDGVGENIVIEFSGADFRMAPSGRVFYSTESGQPVSLEIGPGRAGALSVPLEFQARQYQVVGRTHTSDGQFVESFEKLVPACSDPQAVNGCRTSLPVAPMKGLAAGVYVMTVTVADADGATRKTYTVSFTVQ
jgi:GWxTD domain-containing protein